MQWNVWTYTNKGCQATGPTPARKDDFLKVESKLTFWTDFNVKVFSLENQPGVIGQGLRLAWLDFQKRVGFWVGESDSRGIIGDFKMSWVRTPDRRRNLEQLPKEVIKDYWKAMSIKFEQ